MGQSKILTPVALSTLLASHPLLPRRLMAGVPALCGFFMVFYPRFSEYNKVPYTLILILIKKSMDRCFVRLEFQTEMLCGNSILRKLISTYRLYMNFKGHRKYTKRNFKTDTHR